MAKRGLQHYRRLNAQHAAGAIAIKVWVCTNPRCGVTHEGRADNVIGREIGPTQCMGCGGIEFYKFDSKTEARHWSQLVMLEKRGVISGLRRQVAFPLYACGPGGEKIKVTLYIADFVWTHEGKQVIGDSKPAAGVDNLAALKLKMMEAQGDPVTIITKGIYG